MNRTTPLTLTTALVLVVLASTPATAQDHVPVQSTVRGFSVGLHGSTTALSTITDRNAEPDRRLWVEAAYGLTDQIAIRGATSGDRDTLYLSHLEGRYTFGARSSRWRPHVGIGLASLTSHDAAPAMLDGRASVQVRVRPTLATGLSYYVSRSVAMDMSVRRTFRDDDSLRCQGTGDNRACTPSTRVYFGLSWYPWSR